MHHEPLNHEPLTKKTLLLYQDLPFVDFCDPWNAQSKTIPGATRARTISYQCVNQPDCFLSCNCFVRVVTEALIGQLVCFSASVVLSVWPKRLWPGNLKVWVGLLHRLACAEGQALIGQPDQFILRNFVLVVERVFIGNLTDLFRAKFLFCRPRGALIWQLGRWFVGAVIFGQLQRLSLFLCAWAFPRCLSYLGGFVWGACHGRGDFVYVKDSRFSFFRFAEAAPQVIAGTPANTCGLGRVCEIAS